MKWSLALDKKLHSRQVKDYIWFTQFNWHTAAFPISRQKQFKHRVARQAILSLLVGRDNWT
jgi:hypothetical protein